MGQQDANYRFYGLLEMNEGYLGGIKRRKKLRHTTYRSPLSFTSFTFSGEGSLPVLPSGYTSMYFPDPETTSSLTCLTFRILTPRIYEISVSGASSCLTVSALINTSISYYAEPGNLEAFSHPIYDWNQGLYTSRVTWPYHNGWACHYRL